MKKVVGLVILILLGIGFFLFGGNNSNIRLEKYSVEDVSGHSTEKDCWMIIDGKVYNVTRYIKIHPGGREIIRGCGIDASSLFKDRTTAEGEKVGSGNPHSSNAENILNRYIIGEIN
jgi:cytochrome b involved in lipid metabolism